MNGLWPWRSGVGNQHTPPRCTGHLPLKPLGHISRGRFVVLMKLEAIHVFGDGALRSNEVLDYSVANREKPYFILGRYA
ncbi:hypothetical protein NDU88_006483 [Pleurodeles waltl]|uniref:Uncharacterized protein n=1 Tax=Pleurodeles waltl TaxID=8319 RepID=A0AAV7WEF7_PLEWA|nr:hypothetical protein NDU88_006483 [Pleurodeles waltl]